VLPLCGNGTLLDRFLCRFAIEEDRFAIDSDTTANDFDTLLSQGLVEDGTIATCSLGGREQSPLLECVIPAFRHAEHFAQLLEGYEPSLAWA